MIKHVHIENFKCFKEFDIDLDPLTVLIGPNDSGKTAFLQAIRLASGLEGNVNEEIGQKIEWHWQLSENPIEINLTVCPFSGTPMQERFLKIDKQMRGSSKGGPPQRTPQEKADWDRRMIGEVSYLKFGPASLREPKRFSAKLSKTGEGLSSLIERLRSDIDRFKSLQDAFCSRFPAYVRLGRDVKQSGDADLIGINFVTRDGVELPARSVSDGVMLSLAFMALEYAEKPAGHRILLIEEPENGVHHASLHEIIETLRRMTETGTTQVILTTHSPYLLDEVEPEQVRVFAKMEDGSVQARRLSDYPDVERMKKHFETGEIWTEFDEAEIVKGKAGH